MHARPVFPPLLPKVNGPAIIAVFVLKYVPGVLNNAALMITITANVVPLPVRPAPRLAEK